MMTLFEIPHPVLRRRTALLTLFPILLLGMGCLINSAREGAERRKVPRCLPRTRALGAPLSKPS